MKLIDRDLDLGLLWAKYINTWGQVGAVVGTVNFIMLVGVFYTTSIEPSRIHIPLWLYVLVIFIGAVIGVTFVLKIGIAGYYRFFSQQSELSQVNLRVKILMNHFGIDESEMLRMMKEEKASESQG